jgi:hypothetical protein
MATSGFRTTPTSQLDLEEETFFCQEEQTPQLDSQLLQVVMKPIAQVFY